MQFLFATVVRTVYKLRKIFEVLATFVQIIILSCSLVNKQEYVLN
jgi:hypothetical protein